MLVSNEIFISKLKVLDKHVIMCDIYILATVFVKLCPHQGTIEEQTFPGSITFLWKQEKKQHSVYTKETNFSNKSLYSSSRSSFYYFEKAQNVILYLLD